MTRDELSDILCDMGAEGSIMIDGFENACIGISSDGRVVYDYNEMISSSEITDGMTEEEAIDWISYNTMRSLDYIDEDIRPIIIYPLLYIGG